MIIPSEKFNIIGIEEKSVNFYVKNPDIVFLIKVEYKQFLMECKTLKCFCNCKQICNIKLQCNFVYAKIYFKNVYTKQTIQKEILTNNRFQMFCLPLAVYTIWIEYNNRKTNKIAISINDDINILKLSFEI